MKAVILLTAFNLTFMPISFCDTGDRNLLVEIENRAVSPGELFCSYHQGIESPVTYSVGDLDKKKHGPGLADNLYYLGIKNNHIEIKREFDISGSEIISLPLNSGGEALLKLFMGMASPCHLLFKVEGEKIKVRQLLTNPEDLEKLQELEELERQTKS